MKLSPISVTALLVLLTGCGGGSDSLGGGGSASSSSGGLPSPASAPPLKTELAAKYGVVGFPVGAAIEPASTTSTTDSALLIKHFSSVTAENAMKPDTVWPSKPGTAPAQPADAPNYTPGDTIYNFALANGIKVRGHTLLWHQTAPSWMFVGDLNDPAGYRATVQQHLRDYIYAVVQHYPQVYAWDVVNEVASDTPNDSNPYRTASPWYQAYAVSGNGKDYVVDAFKFATEARALAGRSSSNMKLMLNDYNTELPGKRANVLAIVQDILLSGVGAQIDGVGHQFHLSLNADVSQVTAAFVAVEGLGANLVNHVTELDVSIYADPGSCFSARTIPPCLADVGVTPPQTLISQQALKYRELFNAFNRPSVTSVTTWGIADNHTWLNSFPVTRINHPLLFDRSSNPKWAFWTVVNPTITPP